MNSQNTQNKFLGALNEKQAEAVTLKNQSALVLAGAGSGKTRVLIQRILWLVEDNEFSPFSILAVTFTNKAAKEIKRRCCKYPLMACGLVLFTASLTDF